MTESTLHTSIGELISAFYDEFLAAFGDEELASVLTAQAVNDLLEAEPVTVEQPLDIAA